MVLQCVATCDVTPIPQICKQNLTPYFYSLGDIRVLYNTLGCKFVESFRNTLTWDITVRLRGMDLRDELLSC